MRPLSRRVVAVCAMAGLLACATPGWSQYQGAFGTTWNNPNSALISHYIQHNMQAMQLRNALVGQMAAQSALGGRSGSGKTRKQPATKPPARKPSANPTPKPTATAKPPANPVPKPVVNPAPVAGGSTTFQAIPARVLPAKFGQQFGKTPEEQKRLEGLMHQVLNSWETQALTRMGAARFNELWDLSKAVPYAVAVTQGVYRGNGAPPSREMIEATQRTLGEQLRQNPAIAKMSDLQKQEIYETQAVMTFLLESGRQVAARSHDLEGEKKIQEMAGRFLTAMIGEPPDKIEISNDGFVLHK